MPPPRADLLHTALWAAAGIALLVLMWLLGPILAPFIVGAVFAYVSDPAVNWLVSKRLPRPLAVLLVILAMGASVLLLLLIVVPVFWREVAALIARLPELVEAADSRFLPLINERLGTNISLDVASLRER